MITKIFTKPLVALDGKTHNQIDLVLIENKNAKLVKNVRTYRGAEIISDHLMVIMKLEQKVPNATDGKANARKHLNMVGSRVKGKKWHLKESSEQLKKKELIRQY